ncbi:DUF6522 family protein [Shinella sp. CPCC 101442]|uniref:DUF6522 family protein n=1 Tax=Shinella sp. CPCC 101442 TaxID=2932265 RepID=UPI00215323CB|nr:DUF6522 family protein [Shinella sp. CPCC 101442]MCR6499375.1 DUF6522 family protein [Shinella sp. CPCC 101442]
MTAAALTLARDESGEFLLPADMLAERFGWPTETLHDMMRRGLVSSRVERGEGEDAGRWRLSVRCGNRRWQAIVEADGTVGQQRIDVLPAAPARKQR